MIGSAELERVLRNPLQDAPRYLYARTVDLHDPERGRFILRQLALAAADYGSPRKDPATIVGLRDACRSIAERRGVEWAGALGFLASDLRYERGFVDHVQMSARLLVEEGGHLLTPHPVVSLRLEDVGEISARRLFETPALERLHALDLSGAQLGDEGILELARSPRLRNLVWLSLYDNQVGLRGAAALARSEHLQDLQYVAFGKNYVQVTPRAYGRVAGGRPDGFRLTPEGESLVARYGRRSWLVNTDWERFPPEPYDVLTHLGLYRPPAARGWIAGR